MGDSGLNEMKLTEEEITLNTIHTDTSRNPITIYRLEIGSNHIFEKTEAEQLKQQILDDYEKARQRDKVVEKLAEMNTTFPEVIKLRELIEKRIEYLKNWKGIRKEWHERAVEELQKLLQNSKNE